MDFNEDLNLWRELKLTRSAGKLFHSVTTCSEKNSDPSQHAELGSLVNNKNTSALLEQYLPKITHTRSAINGVTALKDI